MRNEIRRICVLTLLAVLAAGCEPAYRWNGEVVDPARVAPELFGTNWNGDRFQLSDVKGQVAIVFFGYTFCPDVCPFTLAKMKQLFTQLGEQAADVAVVFVSVDPHRDSLEKLASYVPNFDSRFYGLRLEFDELDTTQETWDLTVQYGQPKDGPGTDSFYYVDHTSFFYVVDREGQLRLTWKADVTVDEVASDIGALLES